MVINPESLHVDRLNGFKKIVLEHLQKPELGTLAKWMH